METNNLSLQITELKSRKTPNHLAVIMDGNGRWAKQKGMKRIFGHKNALTAVRETINGCSELGIKHLTLYAFSTENWNRPKLEVDALMSLLVSTLKKELEGFLKNNIKINAIGNLEQLPSNAKKTLEEVIQITKKNTKITVTFALSYGGREEIVNAIKSISKKVVNNDIEIKKIDEKIINNHLYTFNLPDVDLMIRTSGEQRISNFLLWQMAYAEFYFTDVLWPDFRRKHLFEAIYNYQNRERRFGKTSEQIDNQQ